jgi:hypothetical protein
MHQAAEYVVAAVFVAQGVQSPTPIVPSILGGLVMINTACAKGPLAAFRLFGPRIHRILDWVVVGVIAAAAAAPFLSIESGTRLIIGGFAVVLAFIAWKSDYAPKAPKPKMSAKAPMAPNVKPAGESEATKTAQPSTPGPSSGDAFGRWAGRTAAKGINAYRGRKRY